MFCWIAKSWRCLICVGLSRTVTEPPAPSVSVSIDRFGSCCLSRFATFCASSPLRRPILTVSTPSLATPVKGILSLRSIVR